MLTEKYYGNFYVNPGSSGGSGGLTPVAPEEPETLVPGMVVIEEQTVTTETSHDWAIANIYRPTINTEELLVNFDGKDYLVPRYGEGGVSVFYGEKTVVEGNTTLSFANFPFMLIAMDAAQWQLCTPEAGTYTISAKIPDSKGTPKVLRITKAPRTVLNQLCRVSKALKSQNQTDNNTQTDNWASVPFTPPSEDHGEVPVS